MATYGYDERFQLKILSLAVRDPVFLSGNYEVILPQYFDFPHLVSLCRMILEYYSKFRNVPTADALEALVLDNIQKLSIGESFANQLLDAVNQIYTMDLSDGDFVKDRVIRFARTQSIRLALSTALNILKEDGDIDSINDIISKALSVGVCGDSLGYELFSSLMETPKILNREGSPFTRRVKTLIPRLDYALQGGLGAGQVAVICGGTGQGKSISLVNFGVAATFEGNSVIYITLELSEEDVLLRASSRVSGVPMDDIVKNSSSFLEKIGPLSKHVRYFRIKWLPPYITTVGHIKSYISRLMMQDHIRPGLIIVDYADLLSSKKSKGDNTYLSMGDVYLELINVAKDFNCPVWTASQYNRTGMYSKDVVMDSISDSAMKLFTADVVVIMRQDRQMKIEHKVNLYIDKCRRGQDQIQIPCLIDYSTSKITQAE